MSSSNNSNTNYSNNLPIDPLVELERRVNELRSQNEQVKRLISVAREVGDLNPSVEIQEQRIEELISRYTAAIRKVKDSDSVNE